VSLPTSRQAYQDCFDLFDKAIEDPKGIRFKVADYDEAFRMRQRLHYARSLDRKANETMYEPGMKMHGCSIYDPIAVRIKELKSGTYLYVEPIDLDHDKVETLSDLEEEEVPADRTDKELVLAAVVEAVRRRF